MARKREIDRLKSEMEELFADLCQVPRATGLREGFRPNVDVYRTDNPATVTVVVELAGVDPAAVNLAVVEGVLVVSGTRQRAADERRLYQHMEIDHGSFLRRVALADPIDADAIEATYDHGLLTIVLPIAQARRRHVRVDVTRRGAE